MCSCRWLVVSHISNLNSWLDRVFRRFIYNLYITSNLPWVYGGEYDQFSRLIKTVVQAWINFGLQVYFVFDGEVSFIG